MQITIVNISIKLDLDQFQCIDFNLHLGILRKIIIHCINIKYIYVKIRLIKFKA
jgi:hypothetical protein